MRVQEQLQTLPEPAKPAFYSGSPLSSIEDLVANGEIEKANEYLVIFSEILQYTLEAGVYLLVWLEHFAIAGKIYPHRTVHNINFFFFVVFTSFSVLLRNGPGQVRRCATADAARLRNAAEAASRLTPAQSGFTGEIEGLDGRVSRQALRMRAAAFGSLRRSAYASARPTRLPPRRPSTALPQQYRPDRCGGGQWMPQPMVEPVRQLAEPHVVIRRQGDSARPNEITAGPVV